MVTLSPSKTALILIDLQHGITSLPTAPYSGPTIVERSKKIAEKFREQGALVVLVNVAFAHDNADALNAPVDRPLTPPGAQHPQEWAELAPGLAAPTDLRITKHQWGAFYGTELDLQLRRRGITSLVIGGIATNFGVESTARAAHEHGYAVTFAEDLTASLSEDMHHFSYAHIFPSIGHVCTSDALSFEK